MIPRYANAKITAIWTDEAKLARWDKVELAVLEARAELGDVEHGKYRIIANVLKKNPADIVWWKARDNEISHDLNAYIDERRRHIPSELQHLFHQDMTSYDTEEAAFALGLIASADVVLYASRDMFDSLKTTALKYRHLPFLDRTHGQGAKLRSFGGRALTWIAEMRVVYDQIERARESLFASRLSGAIGNYGGRLTPEIEALALGVLGLRPFYGATQIMPRAVYTPLAQALMLMAGALNKMATDIRLGARTPRPICQEPFGKKQKGSSAMPHKKNTILTEQMSGMERMARGFSHMLEEGSQTWEARAIEQSCVERVAWPDLFHVVMRMLTVMDRVVDGLVVYPENMQHEIDASRGTYASDEAKNFLGEQLSKRSIDAEVAYRIIQLASFSTFADRQGAIDEIIVSARLKWLDGLEAALEDVGEWNMMLTEVFSNSQTRAQWQELFKPTYLLRHEDHLFDQMI